MHWLPPPPVHWFNRFKVKGILCHGFLNKQRAEEEQTTYAGSGDTSWWLVPFSLDGREPVPNRRRLRPQARRNATRKEGRMPTHLQLGQWDTSGHLHHVVGYQSALFSP